ncbi:MAG: Rieske 2Fe-2S domain-containing protein [Longimicrobiales bacterium]
MEETDVRVTAPDVIDEVNALIERLQCHADAEVVQQVGALLESIDVIHRTALTHLMDAIRGMAGDAFVNRLIADPAIRLLLMSYDLIAVDRRLQAEEALDAVRGHLHARGIDVELLEVVGGAVYVRLHGIEAANVTVAAVRQDVESALTAGLIGFQQLELQARDQKSGKLIQLMRARPMRKPVYQRVGGTGDFAGGPIHAVEVDDLSILLVQLDGEVYAVQNRCGDTPLPLQFSVLEGATLKCSWHGCIYDIRTGRRMDMEGDNIPVYPVSVTDEGIHIARSTEEQT